MSRTEIYEMSIWQWPRFRQRISEPAMMTEPCLTWAFFGSASDTRHTNTRMLAVTTAGGEEMGSDDKRSGKIESQE